MDFAYSATQEALKQRIQALCAAHCSEEKEAARDKTKEYPHELHQALAQAGIFSHCLPQEFGGQAGTLLDLVVLAEQLSRASQTAVTMMFVNSACGSIINLAGTADQKKQFLKGLGEGKLKFAFALTEKDAGSDAASIKTFARRDGDHYVINGGKYFTTGAMDADFILTAARTHETEKIGKAASLILVPANSAGLTKTPLDKIAGNSIATCELTFKDVRVDQSLRIGAENGGWPVLAAGALYERLVVAAGAIGVAQMVLDAAIGFANKREQFGQPIGRFQAIQHQIANMATELQAMRWMTYHAAWLADQKADAFMQVCMAKVFCTEAATRCIEQAMKIFGGCAYLTENSLSRKWREAILFWYAGGTNEIQRNAIARGLGLI
jgi:alkylation response protein AidB-like acyl-CoA dehydrogenase